MDRFTQENALYMTDDGPVEIANMTREQLAQLVVQLMNEQERTRDRHAHEREILTGQRWRL